MLSALAQGYGTWEGLTNISEPGTLPSMNLSSEHKHGVTVKSARRHKPRIVTVEQVDGCIHIPKTYLTRKGALVLYSSEQEMEKDKMSPKPIDVEKAIQRLGNVRRLMASVLYLNDSQDADPDMSVSDKRNEVFMGFLKTIDSVLYKQRIQPGHDLNFYLKSLRMRARRLVDVAGADIAQQINALLCTPISRPSTSGNTATRKLSSAKLTASLKSASYMGRRIQYPVLDTSMHDPSGTDTALSTLTWPNHSHRLPSAAPKSAATKSGSSAQRRHSAGRAPDASYSTSRSVSEADNASSKIRASSAISTASGSLVEDLTLFEEVDIPLPIERAGPEPDSDLESEYFKSVLNIDELPRPGLADSSVKVDREVLLTPSTDRHLTNTPDIESSFLDIKVKESAPMTPEITLRSGNSGMFNIFDSHVIEDESTVKPHRSSNSSRNRQLVSSHKSVSNQPTLEDEKSLARADESQPKGTHSIQSSSSTAQPLHIASEPTNMNNLQINVTYTLDKQLPVLAQQNADGVLAAEEKTAPGFPSPSAAQYVTGETRPFSASSSKESSFSVKKKLTSEVGTSRGGSAPLSTSTEDMGSLQLPVCPSSSTLSSVSTPASPESASAPALPERVSTPALPESVSAPVQSPVVCTPVQSADFSTSVQSADISAPVQSPSVCTPVQSADFSTSVKPADISAPMNSADNFIPVKYATVSPPVQSADISPPLKSADIHPPLQSADSSILVTAAAISAPVKSSQISALAKSAGISTHVESEPIFTLAKSANISTTAESAVISAPVKHEKSVTMSSRLVENLLPRSVTPKIHRLDSRQQPSSDASLVSLAKPTPQQNSLSQVSSLMEVKPLSTEDNAKKAKPDVVHRLPSTSATTSHQPKVSAAPKGSKVRDADKEALKRAEHMRLSDQKALEALMRDPEEVKEMMASNLLEEFDDSGLTVEEMELAREILNQKKAEAEKGIERSLRAETDDKKTKGKTTKSTQQVTKDVSKAKRKELMEKREKIRQAKRLDQQRRTAEKKALQEMILIKAKEEQAFLAEEQRRLNEIMERERYMNAVAEEARQQEEEARKALAESRRQAKVERERKRKEDLERRKEEAIRRREEQKRMQDAARQKELDMLEKISDAETVRSLREQERKRREEEEWKLQAKIMEEERLSDLRAEDEEARIANIEREAEECAMARLIEERMEAEREEREIEQQRRLLQQKEEEQRAYMEKEKLRIEEELRLTEEEEQREQEAERQRIIELQKLEAEAQEEMKREIEERRAHLMRLRGFNMDKKRNLESIKKNQTYTKPWVFSYYVKWQRESYEKLMGGPDDKRRRPAPRKKTG